MPLWIWVIVVVYCLPGVYVAISLMRIAQCPRCLCLDEDGNIPKPPSLRVKLVWWPVGFVACLIAWPMPLWNEFRYRGQS